MARYKLLAGLHEEGKGTPEAGVPGMPGYRAASDDYEPSKLYDAKKRNGCSDIVESDKDLVKMFGAEKFQKLDDRGEPLKAKSTVETVKPGEVHANNPELRNAPEGDEDDEPDLDNMTVAQLKQHAADEEIDLEGAHTKAEIVSTIRSAK